MGAHPVRYVSPYWLSGEEVCDEKRNGMTIQVFEYSRFLGFIYDPLAVLCCDIMQSPTSFHPLV